MTIWITLFGYNLKNFSSKKKGQLLTVDEVEDADKFVLNMVL